MVRRRDGTEVGKRAMYAPRYTLTPAMLEDVEVIGAARRVVELFPLPLVVERAQQQQRRIEVAHHSTWIENRTLTYAEAAAAIAGKASRDPSRSKAQAVREVRNYYEALAFLERTRDEAPSERWIRRLHATIMRGLQAPRGGSAYRETTVRAGVYLAPMWEDVPRLMKAFVAWAAGPGLALPGYLFAGILAYQFVTIHPFQDGNGRTARALATWALRRGGHDLQGFVDVERFYVRELAGYYASLQMGLHPVYYEANERGSRSDPDLRPWLEYFLRSLASAAEAVADEVVRSFRAAHPEWFVEPLADAPANFREVLRRLAGPEDRVTAPTVAKWLGVTPRTASGWLKVWHAGGLVGPDPPEARRVTVYA